ncbi:MAG: transglutaminase domain-containing protein [Bacteroidales bacterium]|nr:transglutaminase domain-containing protein [Bacteroidales bacterium]
MGLCAQPAAIQQLVHNNPNVTYNLSDFSAFLDTVPFNKQDKLEFIYYWVTNNIQCQHAYPLMASETNDPNEVLFNYSATAFGFAALVQALCEAAQIECYQVFGYIKNNLYYPGRPFSQPNHAWNLAFVGSKPVFIDAFSGSGYFIHRLEGARLLKKLACIPLFKTKPFINQHR